MSWDAYTFVRRSGIILALATLATGCSVDKTTAPELSAPSGFAMTIGASASPDTLPRDGQSTSTVRLLVRDYQDKAVAGQRIMLSATSGSLSASDVTTDTNGAVTVLFTAPPLNNPATSATISATPIGEMGVVTSGSRTLLLNLTGPPVPTASFVWNPSNPGRFDLVTFDATGTMVEGTACLDACTYSWDFGDTKSSADRITTHRFDETGTFSVRLTVTSAAGIVVSSTRSIVVGAAAAITPVITQSPTDALVNDVVIFDGSSSNTPDGIAIVSYAWDFGNGATANTRQATTSYSTARTYTVRLTIVDALGRTATATRTVTIG